MKTSNEVSWSTNVNDAGLIIAQFESRIKRIVVMDEHVEACSSFFRPDIKAIVKDDSIWSVKGTKWIDYDPDNHLDMFQWAITRVECTSIFDVWVKVEREHLRGAF